LLREVKGDHSHFFVGCCIIKNLEKLYYAAKQVSKLRSLEKREKNYNFLICEMKTLIGYCKVDKRLRKIVKTTENGLVTWFTRF
jgi:hypothetical protein